MRNEAERLLQILTDAPGVSGHEDPVRKIFHDELATSKNHHFETDHSGCVLCTRDGEEDEAPRVMITAHMDEVGFMVQNITTEGFLQFVPLGGWWPHTVLAQGMNVINRDGKPIPGCVASIPPHQLGPEGGKKVMELDKMFIDVGASSREEAQEKLGIQLGCSIVPATKFQRLANEDLLMAKAFDNRVGMALLVQAMQNLASESLPNQWLGVATVQEELGCRGAVTAAALAKPDVALVLEGPPADDTPGMNRKDTQGALGGGVQIRIMDPNALSSSRLVDLVQDVAKDSGIKHQLTVRRGGGTDARSFQLHGLGVPSIVLGVPSRYIHSHHSIIHIDDYLETLKLIERLATSLDKAAVDSLTRFLENDGP